MKTVIVTDGKYRSAIAIARALGRAGYRVIITQTMEDASDVPPSFYSRFGTGVRIDGSVKDKEYHERLLDVIKRYDDPVLFPVGTGTLDTISRARDVFSEVSSFLVSEKNVLDSLNDKESVHKRALELGIPVPAQYKSVPDRFPVVIKPRCGEKLGLKAADRYFIADNIEEYNNKISKIADIDPDPIVQEKIRGDGRGVSLLLDKDSKLISAICHRRIREYPMTGGPSTCCITEYDETAIEKSYKLLSSFGFSGFAMVEYKGRYLLEVNPRVWGSYPLSVCAGSSFSEKYVSAASGENVEYFPCDYAVGRKMRFLVNDLAASADLIKHGHIKEGFSGFLDFFRVDEALKDKEDMKAYRKYTRSYLKGKTN